VELPVGGGGGRAVLLGHIENVTQIR
jgi:hypothetical protein